MDVICRTAASYAGALTRGTRYTVLEQNFDKAQVKVLGDNGRQRWFPTSCFVADGSTLLRLVRFTVDEHDATRTEWDFVEVTVELSDGQRRWCCFATPAGLGSLAQARLGRDWLHVYGMPHLIAVSALTHQVIEHTLQYIESRDELLQCTCPLD